MEQELLTAGSQGYDCLVHMAEEVRDASITIPRVIVSAVAVNAAMLWMVGFTYVFCLAGDYSVLDTPTYQPFVQVFYNTTRSYAGATVMVIVVMIPLFAAAIGQVATASRQLWSFARDRGQSGSREAYLRNPFISIEARAD